VIPTRGAARVVQGQRADPTPQHWKNFIQCVRTRQKPVSDAGMFLKVQAALNMSMLSYLRGKVAHYDVAVRKIIGV
jgi:hypothetical protein